MKTLTINRQWRYLLDGHLADTIMCRAFKRSGEKKLSGKTYGRRGKLSVVQPSEKCSASISSRPSASMKRESGRANDANIEHAKSYPAAFHGLLPVKPEAFTKSVTQPKNIPQEYISLDTGGVSNIMLLAHPLAIVYITSCLQDNRMIYVSPQIANLGFTPEAWIGKPDLRLLQVYEEDSGRVGQAFRYSCVTAKKFSCHYRLYDSTRKVHWFHDEASVVCDESGTPLFIRGVMLNITDKKGMEAELAQHRYYLERNVELRTEQLVRRMTVLESCNKALCDKLAMFMKNPAMLNQQPGRLCQMQHEEYVQP